MWITQNLAWLLLLLVPNYFFPRKVQIKLLEAIIFKHTKYTDHPLHSNHWQVTWVTLISSLKCNVLLRRSWVLAFMWILLDMHHPFKYHCGPSPPPHSNGKPQKLHKNGLRKVIMAKSFAKASKFPRSQSDQASVGWAGTSLIHPQTYRIQRIDYKYPGARHLRTPPELLWPYLDGSELCWLGRETCTILSMWL